MFRRLCRMRTGNVGFEDLPDKRTEKPRKAPDELIGRNGLRKISLFRMNGRNRPLSGLAVPYGRRRTATTGTSTVTKTGFRRDADKAALRRLRLPYATKSSRASARRQPLPSLLDGIRHRCGFKKSAASQPQEAVGLQKKCRMRHNMLSTGIARTDSNQERGGRRACGFVRFCAHGCGPAHLIFH